MEQFNGQKVLDTKNKIKCLDLVQQAFHFKQVIKAINKGQTELVILAANIIPIEISMNIIQICLDKNIPYCYIQQPCDLGRACGIKRPANAVSIIKKEGSTINSQIIELKDIIEQIYL